LSKRSRSSALWVILLLVSAAHFAYSAGRVAWITLGGDFLSAFPGPLALRLGQLSPALHRDWVEPALGSGPREWPYGPVLQIVTLPFALASSQIQAMRLILLVDYALVAATTVMWLWLLLPQTRAFAVKAAVLCVWLNYFPLLEAVTGREIELLELFLVTAAIVALRRERDATAGVAVGLATMSKFLPVIFIPYLFVKGFRRAGWIAVAVAGVLALAAQPLLGWQNSVTFTIAQGETLGGETPTSYANQALSNVLYKMFTGFNPQNPHPPTWYPDVLRPIGIALSFAVAAAAAWFIYKWRRTRLFEVECALLAIVMCLVASHANNYYFVFALPALSIGIAATRNAAGLGGAAKFALAAAILLLGFIVPMKVLELVTGIQGGLIARALQAWSLPAFGAILAAGLMVEVHRTTREQSAIKPSITTR